MDLVIIWLCARYLGKLVTQKGLEKRIYQIMLFVCAISWEWLAVTIQQIVADNPHPWQYLIGLVIGLILGTGMSFLIVKLIPAPPPEAAGLPHQSPDQELSPGRRFLRSDWVPILVIFIFFVGWIISGWLIISDIADPAHGVRINERFIGVLSDETDPAAPANPADPAAPTPPIIEEVPYPERAVAPSVEAIYLGFNLATPRNKPVTLFFDWYLNDQLAYSFSRELVPGQVLVSLNRKELGLSEFQKGYYRVEVRVDDWVITAESFYVK